MNLKSWTIWFLPATNSAVKKNNSQLAELNVARSIDLTAVSTQSRSSMIGAKKVVWTDGTKKIQVLQRKSASRPYTISKSFHSDPFKFSGRFNHFSGTNNPQPFINYALSIMNTKEKIEGVQPILYIIINHFAHLPRSTFVALPPPPLVLLCCSRQLRPAKNVFLTKNSSQKLHLKHRTDNRPFPL